MRILMVPMQYPTAPGESYLTTELADALVLAGHDVEVLHLDWSAPGNSGVEEFRTSSGVRVIRCSAKSVSSFGALLHGASKFLLSGRHSARIAARYFDLSSFDTAIAWMPAVAIAPLVKRFERARIPHRLLFIWDFFPDHHHEIGRMGGLAVRIARAWEQRVLKRFTAIICTLAGNADYLRRRFRVSEQQRVLVTPVWGKTTFPLTVDRAAIRRKHGLPTDAPIAIFGGQLVEGRGFEQMLAAADAALAATSKLNFLFVGDGRLASRIRGRAAKQANVLYRPPLSRSDYIELLGACDVGMVATVPGVTSFTIPSKTIDYLRAGLPIIAAVEHGNDFIRILDEYGVGSAVPFANSELFFTEAERLAGRGPISEGARRCLEEVFDVRHAIATILEASGRNAEAKQFRSPQPSAHKPRHSQSAGPALRRQRSEPASTQP
jgi:glycosyltransferase involved in cell wall biosynthesis